MPTPASRLPSDADLRQLLLTLLSLQSAAESRLRHLSMTMYALCATLLVTLPAFAVLAPLASDTLTTITVTAGSGTRQLRLRTGDLLWGALGGVVGVVAALNRFRLSGPGSVVPVAQLVLKPLAGAAFAVVGVVVVGGDLISQVEAVPPSALPAWAALFGFSQQLLTRLLDRRADELATAASPTNRDTSV